MSNSALDIVIVQGNDHLDDLAVWVAFAQIPYLIWVSIATVLQLWMTVANR